jgi:hypothetical protein
MGVFGESGGKATARSTAKAKATTKTKANAGVLRFAHNDKQKQTTAKTTATAKEKNDGKQV